DIAEVTDAGVGGALRTGFLAQISKNFTPEWLGEAAFRYIRRDYEGGLGSTDGSEDRKDDYFKISFNTEYALTKYLTLLATFSRADNHSNRDTAEYNEKILMIGARA